MKITSALALTIGALGVFAHFAVGEEAEVLRRDDDHGAKKDGYAGDRRWGDRDSDDDSNGYGKKKGGDHYGKKDSDDRYGRSRHDGHDRDHREWRYGDDEWDGYPASMYRNSPYRTDYAEGVEYHDLYTARQPSPDAPFPTIELVDDVKLRTPVLDSYHCFLSGAPWTNCGGRTLRDYFLDQCFSMYYAMSTAANGICKGQAAPDRSERFYHGYGSVRDRTSGYSSGRRHSRNTYGRDDDSKDGKRRSRYSLLSKNETAVDASTKGGVAAVGDDKVADAGQVAEGEGEDSEEDALLQTSRTLLETEAEKGARKEKDAYDGRRNDKDGYGDSDWDDGAYDNRRDDHGRGHPDGRHRLARPFVVDDTYCDAYQEERCLQKQYHSITLAVVQCLTENSIRILFIEHYASAAATNPIEGPVLYLKKLHEFIGNVIKCQPDKIANYPTLWRRFKNYNPTAPYEVYGGNRQRVELPRCACNEASGWNQMVSGSRIHCNNVEDLVVNDPAAPNAFVYFRDAGDITYSLKALTTCKSSVAVKTTSVGWLAKKCDYEYKITEYNNHGQATAQGGQNIPLLFTNPDTLFGLLDGQNTITNRIDASARVRTIAEIAANNAGVEKQPILEGNGVLYYCAFYACRANRNGDASGCFPDTDREDWDLVASNYWIPAWNALTDDINECLAQGFLKPADVKEVAKPLLDELHRRTHICMAENELVKFYHKINGAFDASVQDGHIVFLRRLANEKCFLEASGECRSTFDLYDDFWAALKKLENRCLSERFDCEDRDDRHRSEPEPYSKPRNYGDDDHVRLRHGDNEYDGRRRGHGKYRDETRKDDKGHGNQKPKDEKNKPKDDKYKDEQNKKKLI